MFVLAVGASLRSTGVFSLGKMDLDACMHLVLVAKSTTMFKQPSLSLERSLRTNIANRIEVLGFVSFGQPNGPRITKYYCVLDWSIDYRFDGSIRFFVRESTSIPWRMFVKTRWATICTVKPVACVCVRLAGQPFVT